MNKRRWVGFGAALALVVALTVLLAATVSSGQPGGSSNPPRAVTAAGTTGNDSWVAGPPWDGRGVGPATAGKRSQAEIEQFDGFPLYWLGPEFAGHNLWRVQQSAPNQYERHRNADQVSFVYGTCNFRKGDRCTAPVSLQVQSICDLRPEQVESFVQAGAPRTTVRGGALLVRFPDGSIRLWSGRSMIFISVAADRAKTDLAIEQLRGIGRLSAGVGPGSSLPPPDLSHCGATPTPFPRPTRQPTPAASATPPVSLPGR